MKKLCLILLFVGLSLNAQKEEEVNSQIKEIYRQALTQGKSYDWLNHLTNQIGGRLSGSLNAERAIKWAKEELDTLPLDSVWLQTVMVPKWVRGTFEYANIESSPGNTINVNICALGGSIATPSVGIRANVIEVNQIDELAKLGKDKIKGKIVFFNRPMQANLINTFKAYGGAVDQRYNGAAEAAKYGALAVIVRSLNFRLDDYPHTGVMSYGDLPINKRIPAAAISTNDAELLSSMIALNPKLRFFIKQNCKNYPEVKSHNVIAQINGEVSPEKIILVGAHLDSWDLGDGAHDDGAGVVQSMEVMRLMSQKGFRPKNTIRVVLFANEENGLKGAKAYSKNVKKSKEQHLLALESDTGGFSPRGFNFDTKEKYLKRILSWKPYFDPYYIHLFEGSGSGADVNLLKGSALVLAGLKTDSQRYFIHHHSEMDTFDQINKRELEMGAATMAALVYLTDQLGLE
ncbi:MAG: M20/M25/M40 family metallo-hydrolase [Flavobacteriaceae bacterium]|nr:M20/M25/M40 family metallo-hydrolase [Flavobacteriaceae bacterium]MDG1942293.1 M20/M25/M40 family metallo-hydrolase [Flavobacteriaceae bacterium]